MPHATYAVVPWLALSLRESARRVVAHPDPRRRAGEGASEPPGHRARGLACRARVVRRVRVKPRAHHAWCRRAFRAVHVGAPAILLCRRDGGFGTVVARGAWPRALGRQQRLRLFCRPRGPVDPRRAGRARVRLRKKQVFRFGSIQIVSGGALLRAQRLAHPVPTAVA